jgi:ribosomal protein S18 acetylase RimI-like enzyme
MSPVSDSDTPAISVRPAGAEDVNVLCEMMDAFNRLEGIAWIRDKGEPALRRLLADPRLGRVGLVERDGRAVGYYVLTWGYDLEWAGPDAFLTELYLEPAARGQGLGARVLAAIEEAARAHGAGALHLMVRDDNERAARLYARAGYVSPPRTFLSKPLGRG